jgi:uncharacterized protein YndB with AHSA1/START domain
LHQTFAAAERLCGDEKTIRKKGCLLRCLSNVFARTAGQEGSSARRKRCIRKEDSMHDIMHLMKIHAPSERVYDAITTAEGIRQWWTRDAAIEAKVGAAGEFGFNARRFVARVTVEELDPTTRVRWRVANSAWQASDIAFDLKAEDSDTTLVFAHRGFPHADQGYASATTRWGFYLLSLKRYLQTGKGTPHPDDSEALG